MKNIKWLKNEINELPLKPLGFSVLKLREDYTVNKDDVLELINQLDEPEVLSQEWISEHKHYYPVTAFNNSAKEIVDVEDLQNLLVPKQPFGNTEPIYKQMFIRTLRESMALVDEEDGTKLKKWLKELEE